MSAAPAMFAVFGTALTAADYGRLEERYITANFADAAGLRRISSLEARGIVGRKSGNLAGIIIPNVRPGEDSAREYRLRVDEPGEGAPKYLAPPGRPNLLYFAPGTTVAMMGDTTMPVVITEGEFKCLALSRLANHKSEQPLFMPLGVTGVWNFRGTIGKTGGPNGERLDQKGLLPDFDRIAWTGRQVILAYDADSGVKPQVAAARATLARELRSRGAMVVFLEWPMESGKGVDDYLYKMGPDVVLAKIAALDFEKRDYRANFITNSDGNPRAILANAITAFREASEFHGVLAFNIFSLVTMALKPTPWGPAVSQWSDNEDRLAANWLQHLGVYVSVEVAAQAVQTVAMEHKFHPVREYLNQLEWDGKKRLDSWLSVYLGVDVNEFTAAVGTRWLISAVARIFKPGIKADCALILEGEQGMLKSTALKTLADPWFTDEIAELGSKDASMQTRGVWILELAELDAMSKSEVSRIKSFMSRASDRFRPPYGKRLVESPRQCVFAGSVNHSAYLRDETGGRRFWPVTCTRILIDDLARDRDQLWAEAVVRFRAGENWWLDTAALNRSAEQEQADRYDGDAWEGPISAWIEGRPSVSIEQVLELCLEKGKATWTQSDKVRVSRSLRAIGWERYKAGPRSAREWRYKPRLVTQSGSVSQSVSQDEFDSGSPQSNGE